MQPLQTVCVSNPGATSLPIGFSQADGATCASRAQRLPASSDPAVKDLNVAPGHVVGLHRGQYFVLGPGTSNRPQQFNPQQGVPNVAQPRIGVAQGIASLVGPLASLGTNIFGTIQRTKLAEEQLKRGGGAQAGNANAAMMMAMMNQPQQRRSNTGLIVGVVAVAVVVVVLSLKLMKKPAQ